MEKKKLFNRLLPGIIIGGLLLTSSGFVIAADQLGSQTTPPSLVCGDKAPGERGSQHFRALSPDMLKDLVENSTITQEQADQLQAFIDEKAAEVKEPPQQFKNLTEEEKTALKNEGKSRNKQQFRIMNAEENAASPNKPEGKRPDLLAEAVTQGIISQDQADKIDSSFKNKAMEMQQQKPLDKQQGLQVKLDELINQGTITAEQAAAITEHMQNCIQTERPDIENLKSMTPEERQDYMEQKRAEKPAPLQQLIDAGTLSQEQADEVKQILHPQNKGPGARR